MCTISHYHIACIACICIVLGWDLLQSHAGSLSGVKGVLDASWLLWVRIGKIALCNCRFFSLFLVPDRWGGCFFPFYEMKQDKTKDKFVASSLKDDPDFVHALRLLDKPFFSQPAIWSQGKCVLGYAPWYMSFLPCEWVM